MAGKSMTVKEFKTFGKRDGNGAVYNEIYNALKERDQLRAELAEEKKDSKWYEKKLRNCICPDCGFGFSGV